MHGSLIIWHVWFTKILEVKLFAFAYRLFHEDFSSINGTLHRALYHLWFQNTYELYDMYDSVTNFFPQLTYSVLLWSMHLRGDKWSM